MNVRLLALGAVATCVLVLPLAAASAGPVGGGGGAVRSVARAVVHQPSSDDAAAGPAAGGGRPYEHRPDDGHADPGDAHTVDGRPADGRARDGADGDAKGPAAGASSPRTLGLGLATAARCGPELSSPDGVEAQTCVLTQGDETWARTYYRNATGRALDAELSLMGPDGRTVRMRCAVSADDEPASCETPRGPGGGGPEDHWAVAEFAEADANGADGADAPLLLRSGSNSGADTGS
ncbi:hypothetical protein ACF1AO_28415 [Streptomyces longwoodensis]|uniref:hypothetical protein n=1 Tax=Streptomyces longwoodensis TaxID=68231 RepID=UPI0036F965D1